MRNYLSAMRSVVVGMAAVTCVATPLAAQTAQQVDPKFMAQLRAALDAEPELVLKAAQAAQQRAREAQVAQQNSRVEGSRATLLGANNFGPVLGNPKGTVAVAEFLDYRCHFCQQANPLVEGIVKDNKNVRVVVVMRPVLGPESETLARFALAASLQGKFEATHHALYAKFGGQPNPANDDNLRALATSVGVDFDRAKRDMVGDTVAALLEKHGKMAEQLGINGTPFFVTPKSVIPGAPQSADQLKAAIGL